MAVSGSRPRGPESERRDLRQSSGRVLVCSPARSATYTGEHIQHSGVFDNLTYLWQPDMSTSIQTIGHRMRELGYHATYQGKWHLSANLDQTKVAIDAPMAQYREIIGTYGFDDFFGGVGDLIDSGLGGYTYDGLTADRVTSGCVRDGGGASREGPAVVHGGQFRQPALRHVRQSGLAGSGRAGKEPCDPDLSSRPEDNLYQAQWDDLPLPASRSQPLDAPGRPKAHKIYQSIQDMMVGQWPNEDRRWGCTLQLLLQLHPRLRPAGHARAESARRQ